MNRLFVALIVAAGLAMAPTAHAFTWPPPPNPVATPNGDFLAYSLPLLNLFFFGDQAYKGPGSYSVDSSPGLIKKYVVLGSWPSAARDNDDVLFAGNADDAYQTTNAGSGENYDTACQSKTGAGCANYPGADWGFVGAKDPGGTGEFTGDIAGTWDIKVSALQTFLAGSDLVFFFNQNQNNSYQDIFGWGVVTLVDTDPSNGTATSKCYEFNQSALGVLAFSSDCGHAGAAGTFNAGTGVGGDFLNTANQGEFSFSAGQLCLSPVFPYPPVACGTPGAIGPINHNLGANEAAYAIYSPELDAQLKDPSNPYTVMQVRFAFGNSNNGYEQLFIAPLQSVTPPPVPAPATLILLGVGLLALSVLGLRRYRAR